MREIGPVPRCLYELHQMLSVLSDVSFSSFSLPHHSDLLIIADFGMSEAHPNIWNRDYKNILVQ
jgi:hypothetical protein